MFWFWLIGLFFKTSQMDDYFLGICTKLKCCVQKTSKASNYFINWVQARGKKRSALTTLLFAAPSVTNDKDSASSQDHLSSFHSIQTGSETLITVQRTTYCMSDRMWNANSQRQNCIFSFFFFCFCWWWMLAIHLLAMSSCHFFLLFTYSDCIF